MLYYFQLVKRDHHKHGGVDYELKIYKSGKGDGQLRGYISAGGSSAWIAEMADDIASNIKKKTGEDPVKFLLDRMKEEVDAGKFPV